jgi:membrane-associated phospholipid phosphatase
MEGHAYTAAALRPQRLVPRARRPSPGATLALAGLCLLGLALVWGIAEHVSAVRFKDAVLLNDFARLNHGPAGWLADLVVHLLEPGLFVLWGVALVAFAIARERPRTAAAVVAVMALAPLTAETLKPLLAHPHVTLGTVYIGPASWPSGHTTAGTALALSAVLVAPARLRPLVATLAAAFAAALGVALLIRHAHMPSDVLGGYLVAGLWASLAVAALRLSESRSRERRGSTAARSRPPARRWRGRG